MSGTTSYTEYSIYDINIIYCFLKYLYVSMGKGRKRGQETKRFVTLEITDVVNIPNSVCHIPLLGIGIFLNVEEGSEDHKN